MAYRAYIAVYDDGGDICGSVSGLCVYRVVSVSECTGQSASPGWWNDVVGPRNRPPRPPSPSLPASNLGDHTHKRHQQASPDEHPSPGKEFSSLSTPYPFLLEHHKRGKKAARARTLVIVATRCRSRMRRDPWFPRIYLQQGTARVRSSKAAARCVWPDARLI